jgi:hypothetical protein
MASNFIDSFSHNGKKDTKSNDYCPMALFYVVSVSTLLSAHQASFIMNDIEE